LLLDVVAQEPDRRTARLLSHPSEDTPFRLFTRQDSAVLSGKFTSRWT